MNYYTFILTILWLANVAVIIYFIIHKNFYIILSVLSLLIYPIIVELIYSFIIPHLGNLEEEIGQIQKSYLA